jgi:hypothetical protein
MYVNYYAILPQQLQYISLRKAVGKGNLSTGSPAAKPGGPNSCTIFNILMRRPEILLNSAGETTGQWLKLLKSMS